MYIFENDICAYYVSFYEYKNQFKGGKRMKRHSFKKAIILAVVAALLLTCAPIVSMAQSFEDVRKGFWAGEAIEKWSDAQVVAGSNGKFRPNDQITRAEFAAVLNKIMKYDKGNAVFSDVKSSDWFYQHITAVASAGIMNGYDGKAMPNAIIKRQDAAIMIKKAFSIKKASSSPSFGDSDKISDYALEAVAALFEKEFVSGKPGKLFDPQGGLTRAEAVKIVSNVIPNYIYKPGTYTKLAKGNVVINCSGVIIKDADITGDLIVAPSVKDTVTLVDVKVAGSVITSGKAVVKEETTTPTKPTDPTTPSNPTNPANPTFTKYTYDKVLADFSDTGSQGLVKQYIKFLKDPTYTPSNNLTEISSILTNAQTFVNKDFTIKPSIFPTLENVSSSVLKSDRKTLWLGYTAGGVDRINLENNEVTSYTGTSISSGKVLLVVDDSDSNGVWVITTDGVTKIKP